MVLKQIFSCQRFLSLELSLHTSLSAAKDVHYSNTPQMVLLPHIPSISFSKGQLQHQIRTFPRAGTFEVLFDFLRLDFPQLILDILHAMKPTVYSREFQSKDSLKYIFNSPRCLSHQNTRIKSGAIILQRFKDKCKMSPAYLNTRPSQASGNGDHHLKFQLPKQGNCNFYFAFKL